MTTPRFSIVIPVYNRAKTIHATLQSVLDQTFSDYECIVVDDDSKDGAELKSIVDGLDDPRFQYVHRPNGGGGAARNTGIRAATGAYIAFLDSDDFFLPEKLEKIDAFLTDDPTIAVYSYMRVDRGVGKYWIRPDRPIREGEDVGEYLFVDNQFIQTSTIVLPRQMALDVPFDDNLRKGQDLDLCVRLHHAGVTFKMYEEALTIWVDTAEGGRTSRVKGYEAPTKWLESHKDLLTEKAYFGYKATVLAYYIGWDKPLIFFNYLWKGYSVAGVPLKVTLRQAARSLLPKEFYRWLVAQFISIKVKARS